MDSTGFFVFVFLCVFVHVYDFIDNSLVNFWGGMMLYFVFLVFGGFVTIAAVLGLCLFLGKEFKDW